MRALVVGLGSMGRRRIRLLKDIDCSIEILGVDLSDERRSQAKDELGISAVATLEEAAADADIALVCTSPLTHAKLVTECLESGMHVFTELNLVSDGYARNIELAQSKGRVLFLSSTFLYREETMYLAREAVHSKGAYTYHVGQYLPDWHPWESWKDFFVANPRTSGIRELLAIELPWLQGAFGRIAKVTSQTRSVSTLGLPYDDVATLLVEHEGGTVGNVMIDVVCRKAVRRFEYSDEQRYLLWEGTPDSLSRLDLETGAMLPVDLYAGNKVEQRTEYASFVVENAYRNELQAFLDAIAGKSTPTYGFVEDQRVLDVIDRVEGIK